MKIIKENFKSVDEMLRVVSNRPNNEAMQGQSDSTEGSKSFCGTKNWEEAMKLFRDGYTEILPEIKAGTAKGLKATQSVPRRRVSTGVVGYAPHVPNAILGVPNSMIYSTKEIQKVKAVSIYYNVTSNAGTEASEFIKSGIAVLNLVNRLELSGYRVNLKCIFFFGEKHETYTFATVDIKDFREHLDLQKCCFPIAHPSMLRRFGFKWLETCIGLTETGYRGGYGHSMDGSSNGDSTKAERFLRDNKLIGNNDAYLSLGITKRNNFDVDKLIESLNIK